MNFFFDANVPIAVARALRELVKSQGIEIEHCDEVFPKATPDETWIRDMAARDPRPACLFGDGRILTNPAQAQVLAESGLTCFVLASRWPNLPQMVQMQKFCAVWPSIVDSARPRQPTIYKVTVNAKVERLHLTANLPWKRKAVRS